MAKEEVIVQFNEKHIASLSGLTWDETKKKWFGTKKAIQAFSENKEKAQKLYSDEQIINYRPSKTIPVQAPSLLSEAEWETLLECHTSTLQIVEAIHDFGMPDSRKQRIRIFNRLSEKRQGDYPVYYNDLSRYVPSFAARYPRNYVHAIISEYQITGTNLIKELNTARMDEEQRMLLVFVFS